VNHTRFPKEDHLPDWALRGNKITKGDRAKKISGIEIVRQQRRNKNGQRVLEF